jgi:acyl-CoA thioester hydrolase
MPLEGTTQVRVRYSEVDRMGVAHHRSHFVWFEMGRTEFLRGSGLPYAEVEAQGVFLPVIEARCVYRAPARYDDLLLVRTTLAGMGVARAQFSYRIERESDGRLLATGSTTHAAVGAHGRPRRMPDALRRLFE